MRLNLLITFLFTGAVLCAQDKTECDQKVVKAENQFKLGFLTEAESLVKDALDNCKLTRKHKIEAYEVLARINIEQDNLTDALRNIKKILRLDHSYSPDRTRLEEDYIKYFDKFKVTPMMSGGVYYEHLFPQYVTIGEPNIIMGDFDYSAPYKRKPGNSMIGINLTYGLRTNTRFSFSPGVTTLNYSRKIEHKFYKNYYTSITETDSYLSLPLEINQHFKLKKFTAYFGLGYTYSAIIKGSAIVDASYPILDYASNNFDLEPKYDLVFTETTITNTKSVRSNLGLSKINIGFSYNFYNFIVDLKCSYNKALTLMNSTSNFYMADNIIYRTYYIDNNFYCKYIAVNLSVNYVLLYKINKKK